MGECASFFFPLVFLWFNFFKLNIWSFGIYLVVWYELRIWLHFLPDGYPVVLLNNAPFPQYCLNTALSNHSIIFYILIYSFVLFLQFLLCCSIFLSIYASNIILVFNYWGFKIHSLVVLDALMILNVQSFLYYPCFYFSSELNQLFEFYLTKKQLLTFWGDVISFLDVLSVLPKDNTHLKAMCSLTGPKCLWQNDVLKSCFSSLYNGNRHLVIHLGQMSFILSVFLVVRHCSSLSKKLGEKSFSNMKAFQIDAA